MKLFRLLAAGLMFAASAAPGANTPPKKPAAVQPNDAALEKAIRARFARSKIAVEGFQVRVQGGVATIEGKTAVIQRKGTATRLARLAGAKAVNNRIEVDSAAREKAAQNPSGGRRRAQVKRSEH